MWLFNLMVYLSIALWTVNGAQNGTAMNADGQTVSGYAQAQDPYTGPNSRALPAPPNVPPNNR